MNEQMMSREELVIWLRDAIAYEAENPEGEADYEFIDECMALLSELITDEYDLTPEQIANKARKITSSHGTISVKKKPMKMKRLVAIAVAAAVLLCGTIAVFAAPALRQMVMSVLGLEVGERIEQNGITYINSGEGKVYSDIAELIEQEGLDIMYPHKLPEGLEITKVVKFEEEDIINVLFNDNIINFTIRYNVTDFSEYTNTNDMYSANENQVYIHKKSTNNSLRYTAYLLDFENNQLYTINAPDRSALIGMIEYLY